MCVFTHFATASSGSVAKDDRVDARYVNKAPEPQPTEGESLHGLHVLPYSDGEKRLYRKFYGDNIYK